MDYLLEQALTEATPSAIKAKKLGLKYAGYGKWKNSSGKTVAKTMDSKLVFLTKSGKPKLSSLHGNHSKKNILKGKKKSGTIHYKTPPGINKSLKALANAHKLAAKKKIAAPDILHASKAAIKKYLASKIEFPNLFKSDLQIIAATVVNGLHQIRYTTKLGPKQTVEEAKYQTQHAQYMCNQYFATATDSTRKAVYRGAKEIYAAAVSKAQKQLAINQKKEKERQAILKSKIKKNPELAEKLLYKGTHANLAGKKLAVGEVFSGVVDEDDLDEDIRKSGIVAGTPGYHDIIEEASKHYDAAVQACKKKPEKKKRSYYGWEDDEYRNEFERIREDWQESGSWKEHNSKEMYRFFNSLIMGEKTHGKPFVIKTHRPILRGMTISNHDIKKFMKSFTTGKNILLPPSGFSAKGGVAWSFSFESSADNNVPVILKLLPNKGKIVGLHISSHSNYDDELEIIRPSRMYNKVVKIERVAVKMHQPSYSIKEAGAYPAYIITLQETLKKSKKGLMEAQELEPEKERVAKSILSKYVRGSIENVSESVEEILNKYVGGSFRNMTREQLAQKLANDKAQKSAGDSSS